MTTTHFILAVLGTLVVLFMLKLIIKRIYMTVTKQTVIFLLMAKIKRGIERCMPKTIIDQYFRVLMTEIEHTWWHGEGQQKAVVKLTELKILYRQAYGKDFNSPLQELSEDGQLQPTVDTIQLSQRDQIQLANNIIDPPEPTEKQKQEAKRFQEEQAQWAKDKVRSWPEWKRESLEDTEQ